MVLEILALADQLKKRENSGQQISKAFYFRRRLTPLSLYRALETCFGPQLRKVKGAKITKIPTLTTFFFLAPQLFSPPKMAHVPQPLLPLLAITKSGPHCKKKDFLEASNILLT